MPYPDDTTPEHGDSQLETLKEIQRILNDAKTGAAALAVDTEAGTVTPHVALLGASDSQIIPAGAKGWSFVVLTGTATVGGEAAIPAGVGDEDAKTLAATLTITTAADSSAYVRWNT